MYDRGIVVRFPTEAKDFSVFEGVLIGCGPTEFSFQLVSGGFFPGGKRLGRVVGHSPPSRVEVRNDWHCTWTGTTLAAWVIYGC
jgi:hypothetical protein